MLEYFSVQHFHFKSLSGFTPALEPLHVGNFPLSKYFGELALSKDSNLRIDEVAYLEPGRLELWS